MTASPQRLTRFGAQLRVARARLSLTQYDVATKANIFRPTYWQYEQGTLEPDAKAVEALASVLGVTVDWLYAPEGAK